MYFVDCYGTLENDTKTPFNFVKRELTKWNTRSENIRNESFNSYTTVNLFNNEYHRSLGIKDHLNELFSFGRKYFVFLSKAARNVVMSASVVSAEYQDYGLLRRNTVDLFVYVKNSLQDIRHSIDNGEIEKSKVLLANIKHNLHSFRLMVKTVDSLPDYVVRNCTSEVGNQCLLASFHNFHIYLELLWLHLTTMLDIHIMENTMNEEIFPESEDIQLIGDYADEMPINKYNQDIERELEWMLYNLILLACKCCDKIGVKQIFSCSCVKQIWLSTQLLIESLHIQNKCANFWHYFNKIMQAYVLKVDNSRDLPGKKNCNVLCQMRNIVCANKWEFNIWLLLNVVQLQGYNSDGTYVGVTSQRIVPNYTLLEDVLKQFLNNESTVTESSLRDQMRCVVKLLTIWWESKNDIIMLLWEYFHKRLNSAFNVAGKEDVLTSFINLSAPHIINDLKSRFSLDHSTKRDLRSESSYSLFITLLGAHLKRSVETNQQSNCQRIKGRILPKFTQNKVQSLNELGMEHLATLFLMMGISTDFTDMCSKLQNLLNQIPFETLSWPKKQVVIKTHICVLYMYVDNNADMDASIAPLLTIANKYSSSRDSESMAIMKIIVCGFQDIIDSSQSFECGEFKLIDSWLPKYLSVCSLSDMTNTLEFVSSILTKLNVLASYHNFSSENSISMVNRIFQHVLTCLKTLYGCGTMSLAIADTAFAFTKFTFENAEAVKEYGTFTEFFKSFLLSETVNEKVLRHYLTQALQDDKISESLTAKNKTYVSSVIHAWIRCSLLSVDHGDDDTHLMLLLCQLPDFLSLNMTPLCSSSDQMNLCNFFRSIGVKWNLTQNFQEKCQLRESVNEYLTSMDKYIVSALKSPPSQEYVMQIFLVLGTMFINCSPIIYSRAKPSCLLHSVVSNILLPPQIFMEKKIHPYIVNGVCKSWYMFMKGLYVLDYKNDMYIEKAMKDMIVQYLPYFVNKTLNTKNNTFDVSFRMIPNNDTTSDLMLEKYILEKISATFVTCRGKLSHIHAPKALGLIHHLFNSTTNIKIITIIINSTMLAVCEQFMFSEVGSISKKISGQILECLGKNQYFSDEKDESLRDDVREMFGAICRKHLAFNSGPLFKLLTNHVQVLSPVMDSILATVDGEISKVERMRGVGFDHGLRNNLKELVTLYSKLKSQQ